MAVHWTFCKLNIIWCMLDVESTIDAASTVESPRIVTMLPRRPITDHVGGLHVQKTSRALRQPAYAGEAPQAAKQAAKSAGLCTSRLKNFRAVLREWASHRTQILQHAGACQEG